MEDEIFNIEPDMSGIDGGGAFGTSTHSVSGSFFDDEHPLPTVDQLQHAGFSHELAERIVAGYGDAHSYSEKELFHCIYESDNPAQAYNEMMDAKVHEVMTKSDELIKDIQDSGLLGTSNGHSIPLSVYNEDNGHRLIHHENDDEKELGSCDCSSECKYNTGHSYKSSNYGYSD